MRKFPKIFGRITKGETRRPLPFDFRASLITQRAASGEKIFRQSKQKTARIVDPMRRFFVTNDGKDSVDSLCGDFLEMPDNGYSTYSGA